MPIFDLIAILTRKQETALAAVTAIEKHKQIKKLQKQESSLCHQEECSHWFGGVFGAPV